MLSTELRLIVIATVAATILGPPLGRMLSKSFPPTVDRKPSNEPESHRGRNIFIEYAGVAWLILGLGVPFVAQDKRSLEPSFQNIVLMLSFGLLFMAGGTALLTRLFGDRGCISFLSYIERERGINRAGALLIAKVMVISAVLGLLVMLIVS